MAVLFAFSAILPADSKNRILTWLRVSWFFLGIGILTGSIWAYRALGWGGYWAWDPIENAALVPWLVMCGYLHNNEYNKKSVCMVPFSLSDFGVFLARSGILKDRSAHAYTEGSIIITFIILSFIAVTALFLIFSKIKKNNTGIVKNDKRLIAYSINVYAALILAGTVVPVVYIETPVIYYKVISIIFALTYSVLLLIRDIRWLKKRNILMMAVSTVLVIGITALTGSFELGWLLLIWVCLMPFSLWLVCLFRTKSLKYYLSHLGVLLLITGAITSSALGKEIFAKANFDNTGVTFSGIEISVTELSGKDTLIKTLPGADLVIQCSGITPLSDGGVLIPYTTKPLIILFWTGCLLIIFIPVYNIILKRFTTLLIEKGNQDELYTPERAAPGKSISAYKQTQGDTCCRNNRD
jgi:cytochrome c-type biogenesis protein CcmF